MYEVVDSSYFVFYAAQAADSERGARRGRVGRRCGARRLGVACVGVFIRGKPAQCDAKRYVASDGSTSQTPFVRHAWGGHGTRLRGDAGTCRVTAGVVGREMLLRSVFRVWQRCELSICTCIWRIAYQRGGRSAMSVGRFVNYRALRI